MKIVLGKYKLRDKYYRPCHKTYKTREEKQMDVNIAIKLFQGARNDMFDTGILLTGDSDIITAIKAAKETFPIKKIGLVIPIGRREKK